MNMHSKLIGIYQPISRKTYYIIQVNLDITFGFIAF